MNLKIEDVVLENGLQRNPTVTKNIPNFLFRLEFGFNDFDDETVDHDLKVSAMIPTKLLDTFPELPEKVLENIEPFRVDIQNYIVATLSKIAIKEEIQND